MPKMQTGVCEVQDVWRAGRAQNYTGEGFYEGYGEAVDYWTYPPNPPS